MGLGSVIKTLLVPLFIALIVYLILTFGVLPFIRKHHHRYREYLPLDRISTQTTSFRQRVLDFLAARLHPSGWRREQYVTDGSLRVAGNDEDDDNIFDDEEGESLVGFDIDPSRREALSRRRDGDNERRLSRDLEEGFRDESDDSSADERLGRSRQNSRASSTEFDDHDRG